MKIALIGSAPSSIRLAPYADPSWQIWGCSPGTYPIMPRCEQFFELHRFEPGIIGKADTQKPWFTPEYCAWMAKHPCVWMAEVIPAVPHSRALPWQQLTEKYGSYFFTSSLAWMFAMAIEEILAHRAKGHHEPCAIGLWGVDMAACPSPETKVLRADLKWVRADELMVGDKLIAFDEEPVPNGNAIPSRKWRQAEVVQADKITKPCYRLILEDGQELVCSDEHKWLTHAEHGLRWRMAKDMVTRYHREDRPTRIVKVCDVWDEDTSWGAGYLAAALDGEGHLHQKLCENDYGQLRVGFAQRENAMSRTFSELMMERGFDFVPVAQAIGDNNDCQKYILRGGRAETMKLLGNLRPRRLLDKFNPEHLGLLQKQDTVAVVKSEYIGDHPVIGLTTSTGTFIAEGFATHNTEEYGYQRAGCQFFAQLARQMDIEVVLPPESDLMLPPPLYGISENDLHTIKLTARREELQGRLAQAQARQQQAANEMAFLQGAIDDLVYQLNTWSQKGDAIYGTAFKHLFALNVLPEDQPEQRLRVVGDEGTE